MQSTSSNFEPGPPSDPSYGYTLQTLLEVQAPKGPDGYSEQWETWHREALWVNPAPRLRDTGRHIRNWRVYDLTYQSTGQFKIEGWLLVPRLGNVKRGFVVGHGYGGREGPDSHLPFDDAVLMFPCARGISRSATQKISSNPVWHVLHNIQDRDRYIFRGCVEDMWLAVSALLQLHPEVKGHIGYLGISFGGGIGTLALGPETRVARAHLNVPSFGNQPLRLKLPSLGSVASVQRFARKHPGVAERTLQWYDAATSARNIGIPMHCALAAADPMVAPPGQFSIYNALPGEKQLFVLKAGHTEYPEKKTQETELLQELETFFATI